MRGNWEVRLPGGTEFAPVPDDGAGQVARRKELSAVIVPMGAPGAEYRFRSEGGDVTRSVRITSDFPALGRGLDE